MSQGLGLTEAELAENIYRYINLKLDKEAFLRPNRDVVREIYSRFLDQMEPNWRDPEPGEDPKEMSLKIELLRWMRAIFKYYNVDIEFNAHDLDMPTRQRTNTFLNALLFCKAEFDVRSEEKQSLTGAREEERGTMEKIERELADLRLRREELAYKIGEARDRPDLNKAVEAKRVQLKELKQLCEELGEKAECLKAELKTIKEQEQLHLIEMQRLDDRIKEKEIIRRSHSEEVKLRNEIEELKHNLEAVRLQSAIELKQAQEDTRKKRDERLDLMQQREAEEIKLREELEELKRRNTEIVTRRKDRSELVDSYIERANKQLEVLKANYGSLKSAQDSAKVILASYASKINSFVHGETAKFENVNNATYIKSPIL